MASLPSNRVELPVMHTMTSSANTSAEVPFAGLHGVTCGSDFACALDANQLAFCWGSNEVGQLGTGQVSPASSALAVPVWANLGALRRISAGGRHACAIDESKRVWCWGDNSKQQLGQGSLPPLNPPSASATPLKLMGLVADELSLGRDFSFALSASAVLAWGQNGFGQLSTGNALLASEPMPVLGVDAASTSLLASGPTAGHACAIMNGWLWCWGANPLAQLGDGSRLDRYQPVTAIASDASPLPGHVGNVALGKAHTCAIDGAGNIWCWGANQRRQLGRASVAATAPMRLRVY
jgi:alpha-tubulin suppressor-like RCC1 family protein